MNSRHWSQIFAAVGLLLSLAAGDAMARTYTTDFPLTENPISEGGNWINGKTVGLDFNNCATTNGIISGYLGSGHADSTALLTGTWGSNQMVTAVLYKTGVIDDDFPEVELRLRSSLSAHSCTGYEILYSLKTNANCYIGIVRWNGAIHDFTDPPAVVGTQYIATNGSVLKATVVGSVITAYLNGVPVITNSDPAFTMTFSNGNPGVGFDYNGGTPPDTAFGLRSFTATDGIETFVNVVPAIANGYFSLSFMTVVGQTYIIQENANLLSTNWVTLTNFTGTGLPYQLTLPVKNTPKGAFFRVREP